MLPFKHCLSFLLRSRYFGKCVFWLLLAKNGPRMAKNASKWALESACNFGQLWSDRDSQVPLAGTSILFFGPFDSSTAMNYFQNKLFLAGRWTLSFPFFLLFLDLSWLNGLGAELGFSGPKSRNSQNISTWQPTPYKAPCNVVLIPPQPNLAPGRRAGLGQEPGPLDHQQA